MKLLNINLIKQAISIQWRSFLLLNGLLILFAMLNLWVIAVMNADNTIAQIMQQMPTVFRSAIGVEDVRRITSQHFMLLSFTHPLPLVIILTFVVGLASRALAGEIESGTIELLLSRSVTRLQIVLSNMTVLITGLTIMILTTYFGIWGSAQHFDLLFPPMIFRRVLINFYLFHLTIGSIALAISSAKCERGRVLSLTIGFILVQFFMDFFGRTISALKFMKYSTIFSCFDPLQILLTRRLDVLHLVILIVISAACFGFSIYHFNRRDILK